VYSGHIGKLSFNQDGTYSLESSGSVQSGRYAFFMLEETELLELRREGNRDVYRVNRNKNAETGELTLVRVRLSTRGIQELHETSISMVPSPPAAPETAR
jgi:hypothetical protein